MTNALIGTNLIELIGNTPLVEITRICPNPRVRILAKLEFFNPGGSVKARIAKSMIEAGEQSGELTRGKVIIEATSGNTGIGLAMVAAIKGYRLLLAMSESVSMERRQILTALGAEIMLTPGHLGTDGAIEEVYRLAREHPAKYFLPDQYNNEANVEAHYLGTGLEIWEQTGGRVDVFVASIGTTGTLMGCSKRLKEMNPAIRVVGAEPYLGHKIQGLKNLKEAYVPGIFDRSRIDEMVYIDDEHAYAMARRLAKEEGIFVGMSSGGAMHVAVEQARQMEEGTIVVTIARQWGKVSVHQSVRAPGKDHPEFLQCPFQDQGRLPVHSARAGGHVFLRPGLVFHQAGRHVPSFGRSRPIEKIPALPWV